MEMSNIEMVNSIVRECDGLLVSMSIGLDDDACFNNNDLLLNYVKECETFQIFFDTDEKQSFVLTRYDGPSFLVDFCTFKTLREALCYLYQQFTTGVW